MNFYKEVVSMTGIQGSSAYQQTMRSWAGSRTEHEAEAKVKSTTDPPKAGTSKPQSPSKVETKTWKPIDTAGSLVPQKTDYGFTIGEVSLSDKAKDYYDKLKAKFHNLEFIAVSKDMKEQVKKNASAYGNANKMVVLIDEEKLERMANDEAFRNKYEGIIAMSQAKLAEAKNSLTSSGASVKNFGMSVDENGKERFFATVEKSLDLQKERIEKKAVEKREQKAAEKKKAAKEAEKDRIEKAKEKHEKEAERIEDASEKITEEETVEDNREYISFESGSLDDLISKVRAYSLENASAHVMTDAERMVGGNIDFKG